MTKTWQQQLDSCLDRGFKKPLLLHFPNELEAAFDKRDFEVKRREATVICIIAALMVDLFLFSDYAIDPSDFWRAVIIRLGIFTPCALVGIIINENSPSLRVREVVKAGVMVVTGACVLSVSRDSNNLAAVISQIGLLLVVIFAQLVLRLRFPYAIFAACFITIEEAVFLHQDPWLQAGQKLTCMCLIFTGTVLSLFTNHRLEDWERSSYLLLLREEARTRQLEKLNHDLAELSNVDGLTGLSNRRYFNQQLQSVWQQGSQKDFLVSILIIDIDHFKRLNDTFGHLMGDQVLIALAAMLREAVRAHVDTVARFGGEEFVIILPGIDQAHALQVAERVRRHVRESAFRLLEGSPPVKITISSGVATTCPRDLPEATGLVEKADRALYRAKRAGRDRVCAAPPGESISLDHAAVTGARLADGPSLAMGR